MPHGNLAKIQDSSQLIQAYNHTCTHSSQLTLQLSITDSINVGTFPNLQQYECKNKVPYTSTQLSDVSFNCNMQIFYKQRNCYFMALVKML